MELTKAADLDGAVAIKKLREDLKNEAFPAMPKPTPDEPSKKSADDLTGQVWENESSTVYFEDQGKARRIGKKDGKESQLIWKRLRRDEYELIDPANEKQYRLWKMNRDGKTAQSMAPSGVSGSSTVTRIK